MMWPVDVMAKVLAYDSRSRELDS